MKVYILEGRKRNLGPGLDQVDILGVYSTLGKARYAQYYTDIKNGYDLAYVLEAELDKPFAECREDDDCDEEDDRD